MSDPAGQKFREAQTRLLNVMHSLRISEKRLELIFDSFNPEYTPEMNPSWQRLTPEEKLFATQLGDLLTLQNNFLFSHQYVLQPGREWLAE